MRLRGRGLRPRPYSPDLYPQFPLGTYLPFIRDVIHPAAALTDDSITSLVMHVAF
jgi:hypothetical protein